MCNTTGAVTSVTEKPDTQNFSDVAHSWTDHYVDKHLVEFDECGDYLVEDGWEEGFTCSLPEGHGDWHSTTNQSTEIHSGMASNGKPYEYQMRWKYDE